MQPSQGHVVALHPNLLQHTDSFVGFGKCTTPAATHVVTNYLCCAAAVAVAAAAGPWL
jgi:hypothetical protein